MIGAERYCKNCGHRCHCYAPDCSECVNDVCVKCECTNEKPVTKMSQAEKK